MAMRSMPAHGTVAGDEVGEDRGQARVLAAGVLAVGQHGDVAVAAGADQADAGVGAADVGGDEAMVGRRHGLHRTSALAARRSRMTRGRGDPSGCATPWNSHCMLPPQTGHHSDGPRLRPAMTTLSTSCYKSVRLAGIPAPKARISCCAATCRCRACLLCSDAIGHGKGCWHRLPTCDNVAHELSCESFGCAVMDLLRQGPSAAAGRPAILGRGVPACPRPSASASRAAQPLRLDRDHRRAVLHLRLRHLAQRPADLVRAARLRCQRDAGVPDPDRVLHLLFLPGAAVVADPARRPA